MGIKAVSMPLADYLLDDHGHLFGARFGTNASYIVASLAEIGGSINKLNCFQHATKTRVRVELVVWDHLRRINACERMLQGIFEQARRTDCEWSCYLLDESAKVANQFNR